LSENAVNGRFSKVFNNLIIKLQPEINYDLNKKGLPFPAAPFINPEIY